MDVYKACGGTAGNFNINDSDDILHARRRIFHKLLPGSVRHWYAILDDELGVVFCIGKTTRDLRKSVKLDLLKRCKTIFGRAPNFCLAVPGSGGFEWSLHSHENTVHKLRLEEFLGSDQEGDIYPHYEVREELDATQPQDNGQPNDPPKSTSATTSMHDYRWAYFLDNQQLMDVYKACGGTAGNFNINDSDDILHARRGIFHKLLPGSVRHWYAILDDELGVVFCIGKTTWDLRKSVKLDLLKRCKTIFGRAPNFCLAVPGSGGFEWSLHSHENTVHKLRLEEFLGSDREGDIYPDYEAKEGLSNARLEGGVSV
ncbi:hypothetical protein BN14_05492 [Rhizoctonia solani AG-1 IB]|uniref:Uncharacterized protein n=1 Tax=Thanatephorus cucumeris (strain AG1-IB / isolate 7/3/14) TaxID=1108050 RepID=M5BXX3_THACB|nr:hypothetical protein BN14_05492 [Rhizoctonia solani AG-1 IB]